MAGIYFHIPFCKRKCSYCDFYSIKDSDGIEALIQTEIKELDLRKEYLNNEIIDTIYFGGGTPSLLSYCNVDSILKSIHKNFDVSADCEITFETNPDDLSEDYLHGLYSLNINRLSVGIQSFNDNILNYLGRRHDSSKLSLNIETAKKVGFENISVDLIFGIPGMELSTYLDSLNKVVELNVQHVSAYSLTIAEGTLFFKLKKHNKLKEIDEEDLLDQFNSTIDILAMHGFNHYEISNYAKDGYKSRHNSSYWEDANYLGIGPSAHSYNGISRQWNISDTWKYCKLIDNGETFFEVEFLTRKDKYNEYIITGLRTSKGISRKFVRDNFDDRMNRFFSVEVIKLLRQELIHPNEDSVILTRRGILISDYILQLLYFV